MDGKSHTFNIFVFRGQFRLIRIRIYIKVWFGCTNSIFAPNQDLNLVKNAIEYAQSDKAELIALALLDPNVSINEKQQMLYRMKFQEPLALLQCNLSDFVSKKTEFFFGRFGLSASFLNTDPSTWENNADYKNAFAHCINLAVVNHSAERGVKFMADYNRILTNNEEEKKMMLQIVEAYRKKYPSYKKSAFISLILSP